MSFEKIMRSKSQNVLNTVRLSEYFFPPGHWKAFETLNAFENSDFKTGYKIEYLMSRNNNSARPTRSACKRTARLHVRISFQLFLSYWPISKGVNLPNYCFYREHE